MTLEISFIGYERKSLKIALDKKIKPLDIRLTQDTTVLGRWAIHLNTDSKKEPSLWKKFSNTIRNVFS